tara:strand:+ start:7020 stop:7949 length:930 start_codon:yes stop_codon:yes gene_type:complete
VSEPRNPDEREEHKVSVTTKIEWCDSTVNPVMGCEGCELWNGQVQSCYAGVLHRRFGGSTTGYAPSFEEVTKFPGRMAEAARWRDLAMEKRPHKPWLDNQPRFIFISDMGDSLSSSVDFAYLENEVINQVKSDSGRSHVWLWLTKRPQRMAEFSEHLQRRGIDWPHNLWPGTSLTTQKSLSRLSPLRDIGDRGNHRFLSVEPQVEHICLTNRLDGFSWVIQGGESGVEARSFDIDWARSLRDECHEAGAAYFLKQLGSRPTENGNPFPISRGHGNDWTEWPEDLQLREVPISPEMDIFDRLDTASAIDC